MIYQRISLPTGTPVGEPGPLPAALLGLENLTLADLPAALDPCPEEWADTGFWPLIDATPEFDPATHRLDGTWTDTPDTEARTVTRVCGLRAITPEEVAAELPPIDARQLRLTLLAHGLLASVEPAIQTLSEPARSAALIEWEYATRYHRDRDLIAQIATALGLSVETVNAMWVEALAL